MPRDDGGGWSPRGLIAGRDQALVYYAPRVTSPEAQRLASGRVGLMSLADGSIREIHTAGAGGQMGTRANDGHYVEWVEIGVFGAQELSWTLFAVDLAQPSPEPWEVDSGPGTVAWLPVDGPPIALANGRLAYARYSPGGADWQNEVVLVELATRSKSVISSAPVSGTRASPEGHLLSIAASDSRVVWARRASPGDGSATVLFEYSLASKTESRTTVAAEVSQLAVAGPRLFGATRGGVVEIGANGALDQFASGGAATSLAVCGDDAYWVDPGKLRPMTRSLAPSSPSELDTAYTLLVFCDNARVAWWVRLDASPGERADNFWLRWLARGP
jgi:hypothetical protein